MILKNLHFCKGDCSTDNAEFESIQSIQLNVCKFDLNLLNLNKSEARVCSYFEWVLHTALIQCFPILGRL